MKKKALIALLLLVLLVGGVGIITSGERSQARNALASYKAQLREQGEKLTFEEAGYPFPLETNANLENFVVLADRMRAKSGIPGSLEHMHFASPGRVLVPWAATNPPCALKNGLGLGEITWKEFATDCAAVAATLAELRIELERPPRCFGWSYTNPFAANQPKNPFVQKRAVAQFLAADALCAIHDRQLPRARSDLHALTQLVQVHRNDFTLVSAMIRVAIAGLGLAATYEALPAEGWDERGLLALQRDWEAVDLAEALETGLVGERMFGQSAFSMMRAADLEQQRGMMSFGQAASTGGLAGLKDRIVGAGVMVYWRGHMDEDELFYLQHSQVRVEILRRMRTNAGAASLQVEMKAQHVTLEKTLDAPLGKYRHLFSAIAIPNYSRAFQAAVRSETERRLTVTAIALKRFHLRNGRHPAALADLTPQFVAAGLMDPWSAKPFRYRLNADGTFTLYSVGEDGRDDGGDPTPAKSTNAPPGMWTGKDAVWPVPVFPDGAVDK